MDKNTFFSTFPSHYSNIINTLETMPNLISSTALTQKLISNNENPPNFITQYINYVFKQVSYYNKISHRKSNRN